ncbi:unnamed protein product [Schistosoma turkestanicum]|nr:unnamed protein product [Schistosoma turkestanicum]
MIGLHFYLFEVVLCIAGYIHYPNVTYYKHEFSKNVSYNTSENSHEQQHFKDAVRKFFESWLKDMNTNHSMEAELKIKKENETFNLDSKSYKTIVENEKMNITDDQLSPMNVSSLSFMKNGFDNHTHHQLDQKNEKFSDEHFERKLQAITNQSEQIKKHLADVNWLFV